MCASRQKIHERQEVEQQFPLPPIINAPLRIPLHDEKSHSVFTIAAVGDIMLAGSALSVIQFNGYDYPFDSTKSVLSQADLTIGNLEAPFTAREKAFDKKYTFRVPPEWAHGLKNAGFDVLNLANNHMLDYGPEGMFDTIAVLDSLGIAHCGAGENYALASQAVVAHIDQFKIGCLGFSMTFPEEFWAEQNKPGTAFATETRLKKAIKEIPVDVDFLIVSFHWGAELMTEPKEYQQDFAHKAIDLGADIVLGHHAHILQGVEIYKNKLIIYGLGNFAFGSYSKNSKESIILKVYMGSSGPLFAQVFPISVDNYKITFQPRLLYGTDKMNVLNYISEISSELNGGKDIIDNKGAIWISALITSLCTNR